MPGIQNWPVWVYGVSIFDFDTDSLHFILLHWAIVYENAFWAQKEKSESSQVKLKKILRKKMSKLLDMVKRKKIWKGKTNMVSQNKYGKA